MALRNLSLAVPAGQVVGLLGPSGGGKSTLMRAIVGVQLVTSGTVTVLGEPAGSSSLRHRVGYLTQAPSVYADLSVRDNVAYFAAIAGAPPARVDDVIAEVDLTSHARARVGRLSGGQLSRVSLASTLVGNPEILVLDEPTVGLDPVLRRELWTLFRGQAAQGRTVLVSSHVMDEATRCDRLVLIRAGEILADCTLPQLLARTGADDAEGAFLALVDAADRGERAGDGHGAGQGALGEGAVGEGAVGEGAVGEGAVGENPTGGGDGIRPNVGRGRHSRGRHSRRRHGRGPGGRR